MKKLLTTLSTFLSLLLVTAKPVFAQCAANEVDTGLGCIPTDPGGLANWVLYYAVRIAGGLALALLMSGGIKFITAQGDFKAMPEAKKTITSALIGLLVIFFSILILKVIGYDILGLPGWGDAGGLQLPQ